MSNFNIKHLANIDLNNNEIKNVKVDVVGSDPSGMGATDVGRIIYNSATGVKQMKYWDGDNWVSMKNTDTDVDVSKDNLITALASFTSADTVNIGDADDDTTVIIRGNLQVDGTTTTVNSATLSVADNEITLNSDVTGAPSENAGIEVNRGTSDNVDIRWNEDDDKWQFTNDGTNYSDLGGDVADASETVKGKVELADNTETETGTDAVRAVTPAGLKHTLSSRVHKESIGDGTATSYTVTHNLGTRDVIVQIYDNTNYDTVFADVVRTSTLACTVSFTTAPASGAYRVLVTKID